MCIIPYSKYRKLKSNRSISVNKYKTLDLVKIQNPNKINSKSIVHTYIHSHSNENVFKTRNEWTQNKKTKEEETKTEISQH